jgi:hypothetical protein
MTRAQLLTVLNRRLNQNETIATPTKNRLVDLLNEVHREVLSAPGLQRLRDDTLTFASVAGQSTYTLPWVAKVNRIFETTNDRLLAPITLAQYRAMTPDVSATTGPASAWVWLGYAPVSRHPSDASALFVKSTAAGDTTQTAYLEGEVTGGYPRTANVVLTGTTAVTVASAISTWVRVTKFYLSAVAAGTVTLHEDSGAGTELAQIQIGGTSQRYYQIALYPQPSDVLTYTADVTLGVTDLAQDGDVPRLPEDFHDVLVAGVLVKEYEKTDDNRLPVASRRYRQRLGELQYWLAETASGETLLNAPSMTSRLGPWFPAGT